MESCRIFIALLAALVASSSAYSLPAAGRAASTSLPLPRRNFARACAEPAAVPDSYEAAEARGFELYAEGEHERAIRMFELAQTLPGAGTDYRRTEQGGMIGSASAPPNPRGLELTRFATAEQKLIAQYNIACCYAAMRDSGRAVDVLRAYLNQVSDPLNQVNEMLVDADLEPIRAELRELREEQKARGAPPGLFGLKGVTNPLRALADQVQVEWKD